MAQKNLLQEGQTIKHDGQNLLIEKSISSGLTGEVYKATLSVSGQKAPVAVVVKAMKALDFPLARQLFYKEGETLAFLMHLEEETKDSLADNLKIAPVYYGLSEYQPESGAQGFPYLVMEFIDGVQVPELLKQGTFSELKALTIAWHLYRVFDILHTRLLKTFIDLKFENLWWLENDSRWGGQLKLTDFGTLEEIKPGDEKKRGVARDVLLGGVYLLQLLTGSKLKYSIGELTEPAVSVIKRFNDRMTWGTRQLLLKLLNRNPKARFESAAEVLIELRQLVNFWSQPLDRLADMIKKNLTLAENAIEGGFLSTSGKAAFSRAYSALDILRIKDPQLVDESDIQRLESLRSIGDYDERGYALLRGRSFNLARQTFEEGMRSSEDSAFFRRWSYVARIGEDVLPASFEARFEQEVVPFLSRINAIDSDSQEKWRAAYEFCDVLASEYKDDKNKVIRPSLASKGLSYLQKECKLFGVVSEARRYFANGSFSSAAKSFKQAREILYNDSEDILFPEEIVRQVEEEIGVITVDEFFSSLELDGEKSLRTFNQAVESLENGEMVDGVGDASKDQLLDGFILKKHYKAVDLAREAYSLGRRAPFCLDQLVKLFYLALQLNKSHPEKVPDYIHAAFQFVDLGLCEFGGSKKDDVAYVTYPNICDVSLKLDQAMQKLLLSDHVGFSVALEEVHDLLGEKGSLVEGVAVYAAKRVSQQPLFLNALADSVEKLIPSSEYPAKWREDASKVSEEQFAGRHKQVDELMRQVHYILLPVLPDPNNPKTLGEILRAAAEQSDIFSGFDLLELRDRLERLERSKLLLEKAAKLIGEEDEYRRKEVSSLYTAVSDEFEIARTVDLKQSRAQGDERRARIFALSEDRIKIHKQLKGLQNPLWDIDLDAQKLLSSKLREVLKAFRIRCYRARAGDPEGLQDSVQRHKTLQETGEDIGAVDIAALDVFIRWANRELDVLGGDDGEQISDEFKEADADFAKGNFGLMQGVLDSTQTEWGVTPEWRNRKAMSAQVSAWKSWCESKSAQFQSANTDVDLLSDLRSFSDLNLPAVYWKNSPADEYLNRTIENLQEEIKKSINLKIYDEQFVKAICDLLDVTWTKRLAVSNSERREWKKMEWLQRAYGLRKDARELLPYISQTPPPESVEQALDSLSYADWEKIDMAERRRSESQAKTQARGQRFLLSGGIALVVCLVLGVVGFIGYAANKERVSQMINGTHTPSPTLTPTLTSTPTLTPTITLTPTETPTLTPVPPSKFLLRDAGSLYPTSPVIGDVYWLMNETDAILAPPPGAPAELEWQESNSKDKGAKGEPFVYTVTGNTIVTWIMDAPLDAQGYYQVFVLDTLQFSSQQQTFNIFLDQQAVLPYRGTNQVIFQDAQQKTDAWVSLGVYQANAGQTLAVQLALGQLTDKTPFAIDRLLVVRLNESTRQMLDQLPSGRPLVSLLDDPSVKFFEVVGGEPLPVKNRGEFFDDVQAWNGSLTSRLLNEALTIPVWVEWTPENRLSPGTYEVYVWMPVQHATVVVDYFLLADGKVVERPNPATINQKDHAGVWLSLGTWDLLDESAVSLRMVVAAGVTGEIGVDAVAIVKIAQ